jgi:hypothetical protein
MAFFVSPGNTAVVSADRSSKQRCQSSGSGEFIPREIYIEKERVYEKEVDEVYSRHIQVYQFADITPASHVRTLSSIRNTNPTFSRCAAKG